MTADVNSLFIAPLLQYSTKELIFRTEQVNHISISLLLITHFLLYYGRNQAAN